jgi:DNA-binding response OmpR family regulator
MNILVVEDEAIVAFEIESFLKAQGLNVVATVPNAKEAIEIVKKSKIDLILMDIYLSGSIDGIDCAKIAKEINPQIEIIFLSANSAQLNIDRAINIEPLTYLSKPFNRNEVYAAINLAKRKLSSIIKLDDEFYYNRQNKLLYKNSKLISLSKQESKLLALFINNLNSPVSNYTIENEIWPDKEANSNTIRTLIKRLRAKLNHKFIKTLTSQGYIFSTN